LLPFSFIFADMKWLEQRISNPWWLLNAKTFIWLNLAFVSVVLLVGFAQLMSQESLVPFEGAFCRVIVFYAKLLLIPLPVVNLLYFVQTRSALAHASPWYLTGIKFLALFTGILIGTVVSFGIEEMFREMTLLQDPNMTVTIQGYQLPPLAANIVSYGVIGVILALPVFIRQARQQEVTVKMREQELQVIRLKQMKSRAELQTLQAKINPHFLYNSLNSIASLIHDNPDRAEEMVLSLSDLFRYSTNSQARSFSSVKDEVKMVSTYIDVEKVRFGEKLEFILNIEPGAEQYYIPRFLIQPLVENAIKHGTSKVKQGLIELSVTKEENGLRIVVHDNGPDFPTEVGEGYGLKSTLDKLQLLFPDEFTLNIEASPRKQVNIFIEELLDHEPDL